MDVECASAALSAGVCWNLSQRTRAASLGPVVCLLQPSTLDDSAAFPPVYLGVFPAEADILASFYEEQQQQQQENRHRYRNQHQDLPRRQFRPLGLLLVDLITCLSNGVAWLARENGKPIHLP